jgi:tetratricopeptide (TPR) repeat protein
MKTKAFPIMFYLSLIFLFSILTAQAKMERLRNSDKKELIETISGLLKENYVFPDLGKTYGEEILKMCESGEFGKNSDPKAFGEDVTSVLQKITHDKHLLFRLIEASDIGENKEGSLHHPVRYFRLGQREHCGIFRLDWIEDEIGYMDYRRFYYHQEAKELLLEAIRFLSSANAIIIDLRENRGGSGKLIPLLCSYFFPYPTQLTGTYYRKRDVTEEWWIFENVEGKRLLDVPLFVLIGPKTFSAAEYLAYDLKVRKRATLIGEPSGGGAHSVDLFPVGDYFEIYIPTARAVNPVTGSNWEGTGVLPDIPVPSEAALDTAVVLAKKAAQEYGKTKDAKIKIFVEEMQKQLDEAEALFQKGMNSEAQFLLDSAFQTGAQAGLLNEFFIEVLAYHYSSIQAHQMAEGIFLKQIGLFPESRSACESLAWSYYDQGEKELALRYFEKVLELDKNNSVVKEMIKRLRPDTSEKNSPPD